MNDCAVGVDAANVMGVANNRRKNPVDRLLGCKG